MEGTADESKERKCGLWDTPQRERMVEEGREQKGSVEYIRRNCLAILPKWEQSRWSVWSDRQVVRYM